MAVALPAIRFEAEAFQLGTDKILGRQSAGEAFLRAVLAVDGLEEIHGCGPNPSSAKPFGKIVGELAPGLTANWLSTASLDAIHRVGAIHNPDPMLGELARSRMLVGSGAWSLSGVTHTISSLGAMRGIAELVSAPLMEWDGVICTSDAVRTSVREIVSEQENYLAWRMPGGKPGPRLQLPVIPLGVHCADFAYSPQDKQAARAALDLDADEVAFLFVGRLSFHAKANPFPMYVALEEAAARTGKRIVLIQCGWFSNTAIEKVFKDSARKHAPSVRTIWLDGRQADHRRQAWASGDVFISLSDNIQETFGLTPLEAMAAGLPVLVTDWNGYRQTVIDGECGMMIPTFAPATPTGLRYAVAHASEAINYDHYLSHTARHISLDMTRLCDAATALAGDADLRRRMGAAGQGIARARFDWSVLIKDYVAFWAELGRIRAAVSARDPRAAPRIAADRIDPFRLFANYPTHAITAQTKLRLRPAGADFRTMLADALFNQLRNTLPSDEAFAALIAAIGPGGGRKLGDAAAAAKLDIDQGLTTASMLVKMGVLEVA